jgi:hypothetical protein
MIINSPAAMIWAMYLVNAEKRGIPLVLCAVLECVDHQLHAGPR